MKKILLLIYCLVSFGESFSQNYIFKGTGNNHNAPYGVINNWKWDTAAYKKFSYKSPVDNFYMPYRLLSPPNVDPTKKYPLFVMLHGGGEGMGTATDLALKPNTAQMMWGAQIALDSINKYPSYVFFPQTQGGWWGSNTVPNYSWQNNGGWAPVRCVLEIIEKILIADSSTRKIDRDRIYIGGLSIGGRGCWETLERRPDLFAAATPFQGMGDSTLASTLINNPIWNYQGDQDSNPAGWETQALYDVLVSKGGNPKRSEYVDRDHWSWVDAYQSKTWMQWIYAQDKKNIHILFGKPSIICPGDSLGLGIGYGFLSYQWKKDGADIAGATKYVYYTKTPGTYTVVFKRKNGELVTSNPVVVSNGTSFTAKPTILLSGSPALASGGSVTMNAPSGFDGYSWSNGAVTQSITVAKTGTYTLGVRNGQTCPGISDSVTVTVGSAAGLSAPSQVVVVPAYSQASVSWKDNSNNETGFEITYTGAAVNWKTIYLGIIPANSTNYIIPNLVPNNQYFGLQVRAINNQGYSNSTADVSFTTLIDNQSPSAPANLIVTDKLDTYVTLSWTGSTDNDAVKSYDIYNGAVLAGSSPTTTFKVAGLTTNTAYNFTVKARDNYGNTSPASAPLNVTTMQHGLSYAYYQGAWSLLPDFSSLTPLATGTGTAIDGNAYAAHTANNYALKFDGYINITVPGQYTFYTTSDDGSQLFIGGQLIVDNNKLQGATEKSGTVTLMPGLNAISVTYFQNSGGSSLAIRYQGPTGSGIAKQVIPSAVLFIKQQGTNVAPIANAGPDKALTLPTNSVTLNGTASNDPDGSITGYSWTQTSASPVAALGVTNLSSLSLSNLAVGSYTFRLTVTDNSSATAFDDVIITVNPMNLPPVANAGPDKAITLPVNSVTLNGASSNDPDGSITGYSWAQTSASPVAALGVTNLSSLSISNLAVGSYTFRLTVTDNSSATAFDDVVVTVNPAANVAPVANAGPDKVITLPVNSVTLDGSASNDADGSITSYSWAQTSASPVAALGVTNLSSLSLSSLAVGSYTFRLTVTDNSSATAFDDVVVTVKPAATNIKPIANAGPDKALTLPVNSVSLDGSASNDADGSITGYSWAQTSASPVAALGVTNLSSLSLSNLAVGSYTFRLTVTDNSSATAFDDVVVTVNPAANVAPVANAGPDKVITLPVNSVILDGSASNDTDGSITGYSWAQTSASPVAVLGVTNLSSLSLSNLAVGSYTFRLTVTDNSSASAFDDVVVVVNPVVSGSPITSLVLVDADKDIDVATLANGYTLDLAAYSNKFYSIVAKKSAAATIASISLFLDAPGSAGDLYRLEADAPYTLTGNCYPGYNCYNAWWTPLIGSNTITATPYSGPNGTGTAGAPLTITFNVVNTAARMAADEDQTETANSLHAVFSPNPLREEAKVLFNNNVSGNATFTFTDATGKVFLEENKTVSKGEVYLNLVGINMAAGIYFVKISLDNLPPQFIKVTKE